MANVTSNLPRRQGIKSRAPELDSAVRYERALLGSLIERPSLLTDIDISEDAFLLSAHAAIFKTLRTLSASGIPIDLVSVAGAIPDHVDVAYLESLTDPGYVPANATTYVREVIESHRQRQLGRLAEEFLEATPAERAAIHAEMGKYLQTTDTSWRSLFHTLAELENSPPLSFAISGFLPCDGITLIGGLAGHAKTFVMLAMTRSLLTGEPLFGWAPFSVPQPTGRVIYLIPESSIGPFWTRLKIVRLQEFLRDDRLLVRTLSHREQQVDLNDPRILRAAEGSHVFLDTATRFMNGAEDAENTRAFANSLFQLLAAGARTVVGAHHAPKGFEREMYITLENILRGSGDIGAMLSAGWGLRQIDKERNLVFVTNVKPRDFDPIPPFVIQGRPSLDERGTFTMIDPPGRARLLREYLEDAKEKGGRPRIDGNKAQQVADLRAEGKSVREIAKTLGIGKSTVDRMLFDYDLSQNEALQ